MRFTPILGEGACLSHGLEPFGLVHHSVLYTLILLLLTLLLLLLLGAVELPAPQGTKVAQLG